MLLRERSTRAPRLGSRTLHGAVLGLLLAGLASCAGVSFHRDTPNSGTFRSWAFAATVLAIDFPKDGRQIARGNVADARMPNPIVERELVFPYLGPLDFLLDIVSIRYVRITGTWGFPGVEGQPATDEPAR